MNHGKHYVDSAKLIDRTKTYEPQEALELCCKTAKAKFDETVELHVRLGVDSRHADQQVRGAVVLPNGTGKNVRVVAICKGDAAKAAEAAGAQEVDVYKRQVRISPTRFERYISCPFAYFMQYVLGARPRQKAELAPNISGCLLYTSWFIKTIGKESIVVQKNAWAHHIKSR